MHAGTHNPKPICPVNFFEVGGIKSEYPDQSALQEQSDLGLQCLH